MSALIPFDFETNAMRVVMEADAPVFVAHDVCRALGITAYRDAIARLDEDERVSVIVDTLGGRQTMTAVTESGLYALIFQSRKPAAKRFRRWVTGEVLPALRRDGSYAIGGDELAAKRRYFAALPEAHRALAEDRASALDAVEARITAGARVGAALEAVSAETGIGARTLYSLRARVWMVPRRDWPAALAPRWSGTRRMLAECHPAALARLRDLAGAGLRVAVAIAQVRAEAPAEGWHPSRLLGEALRRNYEPRTARAMPGAAQHEFDAGVSFDFNTGAIHRASWVAAWIARNWEGVRTGLMAWVRGGGRVLPGLEKRRTEEYQLMRHGAYRERPAPAPVRPGLARVVVPLSDDELAAAREAFAKLGFPPGEDAAGIREGVVRAFQETHGLTIDGVIGRATLSTLQREIDARRAALAPAAGVAAGGAETAAGAAPELAGVPGADWLGPALLVLGAAGALWLAWRYRDVIAARLHYSIPRAAAWLRSF